MLKETFHIQSKTQLHVVHSSIHIFKKHPTLKTKPQSTLAMEAIEEELLRPAKGKGW